jgi:protein TonB
MNHARLHRNPGSHLLGMVLVTLMHLALAYALVTGLARRVIEVVHVPVQTKIIDEIKPPPPEPQPLPAPAMALPPPSYMPPPEVRIARPPQAEPTITVSNVAPPPLPVTIVPAPSVSPDPVLAIPAVPAAAPALTRPAQLDVSRCAKPEYPAAARRTSATGVTRIRFGIDESGHVASAELLGASGMSREHRQLDQAAIAALSRCNFKAGADARGRPVGAYATVEFVWKLAD